MVPVRCVRCGRRHVVGPADAGQLVLCQACGAALAISEGLIPPAPGGGTWSQVHAAIQHDAARWRAGGGEQVEAEALVEAGEAGEGHAISQDLADLAQAARESAGATVALPELSEEPRPAAGEAPGSWSAPVATAVAAPPVPATLPAPTPTIPEMTGGARRAATPAEALAQERLAAIEAERLGLERAVLFWRKMVAACLGAVAILLLGALLSLLTFWKITPRQTMAQAPGAGGPAATQPTTAAQPAATVQMSPLPEPAGADGEGEAGAGDAGPVVGFTPGGNRAVEQEPPTRVVPTTPVAPEPEPVEATPTAPGTTVPTPTPDPEPAAEPAKPATPTAEEEPTRPGRMERPARPPTQPVPMPRQGITDEEIGKAIERAADFLLGQFDAQTSQLRSIRGEPDAREAGLNALVVYALMQAGQAINDERLNVRAPRFKALVDRMAEMPIEGTTETYARGIRATALSVHNRPADKTALKNDVEWLLAATLNGAYTYGPQSRNFLAWDNSNAQYGVLGVWSAAEVGAEVPRQYWQQVQNHWYETQCENGQWAYGKGGASGTLSMTAAGIATLFVTHDYLEAAQLGRQVGREPFSLPLARALAWLERGDNCLRLTGMSGGYTLYGLERVGLASGFKYFGEHDWYRVIAASLVDQQAPNGSWGAVNVIGRGGGPRRGARGMGGDLVETSYCLLFLARGRHPILMNKLRWERQDGGGGGRADGAAAGVTKGGYWANRPRDLANLARFASRELERPLNWQVVPLSRDWQDWTDSPILYLASHLPVPLTDDDYAKLRAFVLAGGMIFLQADGNATAFDQWARNEFGRRLLPEHEWSDVPPEHEVYTVNFQVNPRPRLKCITNGARLLVVYSADDLAQHWQQRAEKTRRNVFELGVNLFIYAAGKSDLRNRLSSTYLAPPNRPGTATLTMARVRYAGAWDPEPAAAARFARHVQYATGYELLTPAVEFRALDATAHPIAHLTGTAAFTPSDADVAAVRKYVREGGTLLIDACGGSGAFLNSADAMVKRALPESRPAALPAEHPLFAGKGDGMEPLPRPLLRPLAEQRFGKRAGRIDAIASGKGRVLLSPFDLTSGLLGTNTYSIAGYQAGYAQALVKNAVLWAHDGAPE